MNDLAQERDGSIHVPDHVGRPAVWFHLELGDVVSFEWANEIELDDDLRWRRRIGDFHSPLTDILVAIPGIYGALAILRAAERPLHCRVFFLPRRPRTPAAQVVDECEDLFGRRLDAGRALHLECVGLGRGKNENRRDRDDDHDRNDGNDFDHGSLSQEITLRLSGGLLAVDHPWRAELIDQHAEPGGPERLLDRHPYRPAFR